MAAAISHKPTPVLLRETIANIKGSRVDRDKGVIYGVKVVGRHSQNTHGQVCADGRPVEGTDYTDAALQEELQLLRSMPYGINSNVDHGDPKRREARSAHDRFAWLTESELVPDGIFANLHFLDPKDPLAVKMMNAAEQKPDAYALSHNALGRGQVLERRYVVTSITEVRSVDIVSDGGTNSGLFESAESPPMKIKFGEASRKYARLIPFVKLFESGGDIGRRLLEAENEDTGDYRDHLHAARKMCEDAGDNEMAGKIHGLMKPKKDEAEDTDASESEEDEDAKTEKDAKSVKTEESRRRKKPSDPTVVALQERLDLSELKEWIREQCDVKKVLCDASLLEGLLAIRDRKKIGLHLDWLKSKIVEVTEADTTPAGGKKRQAPKASGGGTAPLTLSTLKRSLGR